MRAPARENASKNPDNGAVPVASGPSKSLMLVIVPDDAARHLATLLQLADRSSCSPPYW
jgi:hypothetical protein